MSTPRLTEKLFWETWPKVRKRGMVLQKSSLTGERICIRTTGGACPLVAVARELKIECPAPTLKGYWYIWGSNSSAAPRWAERIADAADKACDSAIRRRLLKGVR